MQCAIVTWNWTVTIQNNGSTLDNAGLVTYLTHYTLHTVQSVFSTHFTLHRLYAVHIWSYTCCVYCIRYSASAPCTTCQHSVHTLCTLRTMKLVTGCPALLHVQYWTVYIMPLIVLCTLERVKLYSSAVYSMQWSFLYSVQKSVLSTVYPVPGQ